MAKRRKKLGEILLEWNSISDKGLRDALEYAAEHGKRLGEAVIELELADEEAVTKALATQFDMEYVDLDRHVVTGEAVELLPEDVIRTHLVLPMGKEDGRLKIIITDPLDLETLDLLRFRLNTELSLALAPLGKVKDYIEKFVNPMTDEMSKTMASIDQDAPDIGDVKRDMIGGAEGDIADAPIIRLINLIIHEAVRGRASDIHVEPMADRVRVRYRIDGVCIVRDDIPKNMQSAVTTRFKIMAGMDIAEKRVPQDGRIKMKIGGGRIDFRVSALPSYHGESVVLRILRPESASVGIGALGFEEEDYQVFQRIIRRPNGIFLVTGPTGSGDRKSVV